MTKTCLAALMLSVACGAMPKDDHDVQAYQPADAGAEYACEAQYVNCENECPDLACLDDCTAQVDACEGKDAGPTDLVDAGQPVVLDAGPTCQKQCEAVELLCVQNVKASMGNCYCGTAGSAYAYGECEAACSQQAAAASALCNDAEVSCFAKC